VRNLWLKRMYHAVWGTRLLQGASAVIATSEQEVEEIGGRVFFARAWCCGTTEWKFLHPARAGQISEIAGYSREEKLVLFLGGSPRRRVLIYS